MEPCLLCHRCGQTLRMGRGEFYVVRIEAVADPSPPEFDPEDLEQDFASEIERLLKSMEGLSEQEALDQVYRKLTLHLCTGCYAVWIEKPTG